MEIEPLAAGQNGGRQLMHLGGGQDKHDMGRRLLQRLEQGVEGPSGQHVYLVDDIHPVFGHRRGEVDLLAQIPDVVHPVVGRGVDFHHIHDGAAVDALADVALVAGVAIHGMEAVDRLGHNLGAGGLARPAGPGEQIRVGQTAGLQFVFEGRRDVVLPIHVGERLGPPFAVQHLIHKAASLRSNKTACSRVIRTDRLPAAPGSYRLMLLGSPPDMVHGAPSHRTRPSVCPKACGLYISL